MEADSVNHSQALGWTPGVQLKRGRKDHMNKAGQEMRSGEEEGWGTHREQEGYIGGRIEESKIRDTIRKGAIIGLKRNQALGKCPEIYKDDIS